MKKLLCLFLTIMLAFSIGSVYAISEKVTGVNGNTETVTSGMTKLKDPAQSIIGAIQVVGYLIAAGMIVYIGVKYIMASASEKADLKGLMIKYVIGAILIIFGCTIAGWLFSING